MTFLRDSTARDMARSDVSDLEALSVDGPRGGSGYQIHRLDWTLRR
jgi:hypothetical protein